MSLIVADRIFQIQEELRRWERFRDRIAGRKGWTLAGIPAGSIAVVAAVLWLCAILRVGGTQAGVLERLGSFGLLVLAAFAALGMFTRLFEARKDATRKIGYLTRRIANLGAVQLSIAPPVAKEPSSQGRSHFDQLVGLNIDNLSEYYALVQSHASKSFWAAIGACSAGVLLVLTGGAVGLFSAKPNAPLIAELSVLAGAIQSVWGMCFYLHKRTVAQMHTYHKSLLQVQNTLVAMRLISELPNGTEKNALVREVISTLVSSTSATEAGGKTPLIR